MLIVKPLSELELILVLAFAGCALALAFVFAFVFSIGLHALKNIPSKTETRIKTFDIFRLRLVVSILDL